MSLRPLLRKELRWGARNVLVLLFLLLLLPAFFAGTSLLFQDVVPQEVPVAVAPADDSVNESDIEIVEGGIGTFSEPRRVADAEEGKRLLERESVYAVIEVPANLTEPGADAEFRFVVDGALVPFLSPSELIGGVLGSELDLIFEADVSVQREVVGEEKSLPEYLLPSLLLMLVTFFAFAYVPYNLKGESAVLDRLRVEASLEAVAAAKILFFTALVTVPLVVFQAGAAYYGYAVDLLAPGAVLAVLLTFALLATVSTTIMILSRLRGLGLFVNVTLMLGVIGLSALAFPLGFFSSIRTTVAQLLPTYYAGVVLRGVALKGLEPTVFADWYAGLVVALALAALALKASIVHYRRGS